MLRVGLTGGIGSGKSTVTAQLADLGASIVDADVIAREVVEPGTPALAEIARRFGDQVIGADGRLERAHLGRLVFGDPVALRDLEGITHPAIWARAAELFAAVPHGGIVVHDMPLLVEKGMTGEYHLVLVVAAGEPTRLRRLVELRGMDPEDARARIAAQADDAARRAAADVWLDNEGSPDALRRQVAMLWDERLVPFAANLARGIRSRLDTPVLSPPDPTWPAQADRLAERIRHALGRWGPSVEHIGSTAVPGLAAKDVIDLQVGVGSMAEADDPAFVHELTGAGFVRVPDVDHDRGKDGAVWPKRFHGSVDPGRVAHVHVRELGSPGWWWSLAFRDLLRADPRLLAEYATVKAAIAARTTTTQEYARAKEPWFDALHQRVAGYLKNTGGAGTGFIV